MKWGDSDERASLQSGLDALTNANATFAKLATTDADKLLDELARLKPDELREVVLARVLAEQLAQTRITPRSS